MAYMDMYTETPGSAVANTLQDILANRRATARQQMLDQMNQQNMAAEINYRNQQAVGLKDYHEAQAEWRKAQAQKLQDDTANRKKVADYMTGMINDPSFANLDPSVQAAYKFAAANPSDDRMVTAVINHMLTPQKGANAKEGGRLITMDRAGHPVDTGFWLNPGDVVKQDPAPQMQTFQPILIPGQGVYNYGTHSGTMSPMKGGPPGTTDYSGAYDLLHPPRAASGGGYGKISEKTRGDFQGVLQALAKNPQDATLLHQKDILANNMIREYGIKNPTLAGAVQAAYGKYKDNLTSDMVVNGINKNSPQPLSPQDEADVRNLWGSIAGK